MRGKHNFTWMLCILLLAVPALLLPDVVHHYTNVTIDPTHFLLPEPTKGAVRIASTGSVGYGMGGTAALPYEDTWTAPAYSPYDTGKNSDYFDRYWFQIIGAGASATFDLGAAFGQVYIALSQDHGPYPEEALEYRVWVSTTGIVGSFTELGATTPIRMYRGGWSTAGELTGGCTTNAWSECNDDWSAVWDLGGYYRYVMLTPMDETGVFNEPEIDAVMGIPEPGTYWLLGVGLAALGLLRRRKN